MNELTYQNIASLVLHRMVYGNENFSQAFHTVSILHTECNNLNHFDSEVVKGYLINHLDVLDVLADKIFKDYKRGLRPLHDLEQIEAQIKAIETLLK